MAESLLDSLIAIFDTPLIGFDTQVAMICHRRHISYSHLSMLSSAIGLSIGHSISRQYMISSLIRHLERMVCLVVSEPTLVPQSPPRPTECVHDAGIGSDDYGTDYMDVIWLHPILWFIYEVTVLLLMEYSPLPHSICVSIGLASTVFRIFPLCVCTLSLYPPNRS